MANSVLSIANIFIDKALREKQPIDPLKLQKLIYIAHGWSLAFTGRPLIKESFEAWKYGPVVPELYQRFKEYRSKYITQPTEAPEETIDPVASDLINQVWDKYKDQSAVYLSSLTHEPGSAWSLSYDNSAWSSSYIPDSLIREEFLARLRKSEAGV
jgi:uncharacterized phage-associated protein